MTAEKLARLIHDGFQRRYCELNSWMRNISSLPWDELPEWHRLMMIATCAEVLEEMAKKQTLWGEL